MEIIKSPAEMQKRSMALERDGKRIVLVPTMGYFHEGHLSLMHIGRPLGDVLIVSNFVNPTQFGAGEDLDAYPRDMERDRRLAEEAGANIMFTPSEKDMYPEGFRTFVEVKEWGGRLCGESRPTHFRGVTTIVLKLFNIVRPSVAVFGWKDAQQFLILRRMVKDLDLPIEMVGGDIVREETGLAMSSRNKYLDTKERQEAAALYRSMQKAHRMIEDEGIRDAKKIRNAIINEITSSTSGKIDYVQVASMTSLEEIDEIKPGDTLIALAVKFGKARLIDNIRC